MKMEKLKFAAFIITYERPEVLRETITKILDQSLSPEIILVIDNSTANDTEKLVKGWNCSRLRYHKVGYNSGPAGAAKLGLEQLAAMEFNWVYWGDDNDPPRDEKVFEQLFRGVRELTERGVKLGIFGGKGGSFNKWTGRISSLSNKELQQASFVEVDSVPGGQDMLVSSEVIKAGILPNEKLFFGFEEFDFCLKAKSAGFKIFIDTGNWLEIRRKSGITNKNYRWQGQSFGNREYLQREFYSTRNFLEILYCHRYYFAFSFFLLKCLAKMGLGFKFGPGYGKRMFRIQFSAIKDFFKQNFGQSYKLD